MEICKAPTLRLRVLNKHSITHIMCIKMEMSAIKMYIRRKKRGKKLTHNVDKGSSVTMQKMRTHTHTHTQTDKVKVVMSLLLAKLLFCRNLYFVIPTCPLFAKPAFSFQCCFMSTETIRCIGTGSPGRPPHLPHSS